MPMPFGLMGKGFGKLGSALGKGVGGSIGGLPLVIFAYYYGVI